VEVIETAVAAVLRNEKKLRKAAALFVLNSSTAVRGRQETRKRMGNVESAIVHLYTYIFSDRFSAKRKKCIKQVCHFFFKNEPRHKTGKSRKLYY
jgi:hypothetical protein